MKEQFIQHGINITVLDNIGEGWRMKCICGFITEPCVYLADVGSQMDDHFDEIMR